MELSYDHIIGRHTGNPAVILAHGPSVSPVIPHIPKLKQNGVKLFSCNEWYLFFNTPIDYWVIANSVYTYDRHWQRMNLYPETVLLYGDTVDGRFNKKFIENRAKMDYFLYSERAIEGSDRKALAYVLQEYVDHEVAYLSTGTVALHMLAFAMLMECNPIYIAGVDLDYKKGYAMGKKPRNMDSFGHCKPLIIESFRVLKDTADKMGIEIYATGDQPLHGVFPERKSINELI